MMYVSKPPVQTGILPPPSSHMYIWQYRQKSPVKVDGLKFDGCNCSMNLNNTCELKYI